MIWSPLSVCIALSHSLASKVVFAQPYDMTWSFGLVFSEYVHQRLFKFFWYMETMIIYVSIPVWLGITLLRTPHRPLEGIRRRLLIITAKKCHTHVHLIYCCVPSEEAVQLDIFPSQVCAKCLPDRIGWNGYHMYVPRTVYYMITNCCCGELGT